MTVLDVRMSMGLHRGWHRLVNEDYVGCYYPAEYDVLRERGVLFALADGVSTLAAGAEASQYAVRHLLEVYYTQSPARSVAASLEAAMQQVNQDFRRYYPDSGTTLVAAVVHQQQLVVGHVGDSRAYWRDEADMQCLTRDHVVRVQRQDGRWVGKLTRSLGQTENMNIDIVSRGIRTGDRIVLLSDGITRYLGDFAMRRMTEGSMEESVCALVGASLESGGIDNIGVVVIDVGRPLNDQTALARHRDKLRADGAFTITADAELEDCEESYRHTVPTAAQVAAALHPLASRNWPMLLLFLTGLVGLIFIIMASSMILLGGARVQIPPAGSSAETETYGELVAPLQARDFPIGEEIEFSASAQVMEQMESDRAAFEIVPGSRYRVIGSQQDASGIDWLHLYDVDANRDGWIQHHELPETPVPD